MLGIRHYNNVALDLYVGNPEDFESDIIGASVSKAQSFLSEAPSLYKAVTAPPALAARELIVISCDDLQGLLTPITLRNQHLTLLVDDLASGHEKVFVEEVKKLIDTAQIHSKLRRITFLCSSIEVHRPLQDAMFDLFP